MKTIITFIFILALYICAFGEQSEAINLYLINAVIKGEIDSIEFWLLKGADINYVDHDNLTPINHAVKNENYDACYFLIKKGADLNGINNSFPPLFFSAINGNLRISYLLYQNNARINNNNRYNIDFANEAESFGYLRLAKFFKDPSTYSKKPTCFEYLTKANNSLYKRSDSLMVLKYLDKALKTVLWKYD